MIKEDIKVFMLLVLLLMPLVGCERYIGAVTVLGEEGLRFKSGSPLNTAYDTAQAYELGSGIRHKSRTMAYAIYKRADLMGDIRAQEAIERLEATLPEESLKRGNEIFQMNLDETKLHKFYKAPPEEFRRKEGVQ